MIKKILCHLIKYKLFLILTTGYFFKIGISTWYVFLDPASIGQEVDKQASGFIPKNGISITWLAQNIRPCTLSEEKAEKLKIDYFISSYYYYFSFRYKFFKTLYNINLTMNHF